MDTNHEVISAFVDDEPFDATALADALSVPEGRNALIELIALRHLVQPDAAAVRGLPRHGMRPVLRALVAAAALVVALIAGYAVGARNTANDVAELPAPTRVVETATTWQQVPAGAQQ